jgi:hypothetical protein
LHATEHLSEMKRMFYNYSTPCAALRGFAWLIYK